MELVDRSVSSIDAALCKLLAVGATMEGCPCTSFKEGLNPFTALIILSDKFLIASFALEGRIGFRTSSDFVLMIESEELDLMISIDLVLCTLAIAASDGAGDGLFIFSIDLVRISSPGAGEGVSLSSLLLTLD